MTKKLHTIKTAGRAGRIDNEHAVNMVTHFCGSAQTVEKFWAYLLSATRDLIEARWWLVTAVAEELMERKTLTAAEVEEVIQRTLDAELAEDSAIAV